MLTERGLGGIWHREDTKRKERNCDALLLLLRWFFFLVLLVVFSRFKFYYIFSPSHHPKIGFAFIIFSFLYTSFAHKTITSSSSSSS